MSIIYIGDRGVGKTCLAMELTNRQNKYLQVTNLTKEDLQAKPSMYDPALGEVPPTNAIEQITLQMKAHLNRPLNFSVDWIDTPGEMWKESMSQEEPEWRRNNPSEWRKFLQLADRSKGVLLLLPPYREMEGLQSRTDSREHFITKTQWCNRFDLWVDCFDRYFPKIQHIALCLNKADLFCHLEREAQELFYDPNGRGKDWVDRHRYVVRNYFPAISSKIEEFNRSRRGLAVRCFITSIYNRTLLELPWLYLASYLASDN
jgi:hypothetical protein